MFSRERCHTLIIVYICIARAAAERSDERDALHYQAHQTRDEKLSHVDVREHRPLHQPRFLKLEDRGGKPDDDLKFTPQIAHSEECSDEIADAGTEHEKTGDEAVLHCCGTENVVGWHQHLKEKARELSKHGLTVTEPHGHRASSINLEDNMKMNEYMSLVNGCNYCKCPEDIAKASIDLHKQTSQANDEYLDKMLHGGNHLVKEYKHMAHLSHIFKLMANNMSIRGTIDTANHAINLSQEVARLTKNYKDRMAVMSQGGHAFMKNVTAFSENPAYARLREPVIEEYFKDHPKVTNARQVDFRTLRTYVERMGVLSERPDSAFKYYKIVPTELRLYNGKKAQVGGWKFETQDGQDVTDKGKCDEFAANTDFAGLTYEFYDQVKLGKIAYLPSNDPHKDIVRFTLFGSNDDISWKRIFNAVVTPPAVSDATSRSKEVWATIQYDELAPENNPHGAFYEESLDVLSTIIDHFPPESLLSDFVNGRNMRLRYSNDIRQLKYNAVPADAIFKSGYRDMKSDSGYALVREGEGGMEWDIEKANAVFNDILGFGEGEDYAKCGKNENQACLQPGQQGVFVAGIRDAQRSYFQWLYLQYKGWLIKNVFLILETIRSSILLSKSSDEGKVDALESLVTGFEWEKNTLLAAHLPKPLQDGWLANVPVSDRLALVDGILVGERIAKQAKDNLKLWLLQQERVFVHEAVYKLDKDAYEEFRKADNALYGGRGDYAEASEDAIRTCGRMITDGPTAQRYSEMVTDIQPFGEEVD